MARSQLQKIAEGLRKTSEDAGRTADLFAEGRRTLQQVNGELHSPALRRTIETTGLGSTLSAIDALIDAAMGESRHASRLMRDVHDQGATWVGQLVTSGANDPRVTAAQNSQMHNWYRRSGANQDARNATLEALADKIFSPYVAAGLNVAGVLFAPIAPAAAVYNAAGMSKAGVELGTALAKWRAGRKDSPAGRNSSEVSKRDADHAAASLLADSVELVAQTVIGVDVSGVVGVPADVVHRARKKLSQMGQP